MKRCPKCDASYAADAAWCPVDGTRLVDDIDAGRTLQEIQMPGALTMGWDIPDVPATVPGMTLPEPIATAQPSSLTMGWEIPEVPVEEPPRTTPTKLAATAMPSTLPGVKADRLKAATLAPAAPRMTPKSLAAALAKAPAPHRPEPISTPTAINVPLPVEAPEPPTFVRDEPEAGTTEIETLDAATHVGAQQLVETEPFHQVEPPPPEPMRMSPSPTLPPALGPPPNLEQPRRTPSQSQPPPMRRTITAPMPTVASMEQTPAVEVMPVKLSESMDSQPIPLIEMTAPVPQVSVELRAPITMPGVVAPAILTRQRPPTDAPPIGDPVAVPSHLKYPSGAAILPPAPPHSNHWMWIAIALIVVGGAVGTLLALQ